MTEDDRKLFEKNHKALTKTRRAKLTRERLEQSVIRNSGLTFDICCELECTPKQFWNAVEKHGLKDLVQECRRQLVGKAESTLNELLDSAGEKTRVTAAKFILERLGRDEGWGSGPQIQQNINVNGDCDISEIFGL